MKQYCLKKAQFIFKVSRQYFTKCSKQTKIFLNNISYNQWIKKRHTTTNDDETPNYKSGKFKHKGIIFITVLLSLIKEF